MGKHQPITAWDIGEASGHTILRKFGAATINSPTAAELERCDWCQCSRHRCGCDDYLNSTSEKSS